MQWQPIAKTAAERASANLANYPRVRHDFTWRHARTWLSGLPDNAGLNIGYEAVDRHATGERRDAVALRCLDRQGGITDITYGDLARRTARTRSG